MSRTISLQIQKLRSEREQTLQKLTHFQELLKAEVDPDFDEADPDLGEHGTTLALAQTLERKLASIDHALRLAETGSYGICEDCGDPIDPARLEAMPETTLCLKCKTIAERRIPTGAIANRF